MRLKKAKDFFKNFNKSPLQIGEELYDSLKDDLRDQFLTISDRTGPQVADVQYAIQNGKVRIKILYVGNNQSEIEEISTDIKSAINRLKKLSKHPIDGPSYFRIDNQNRSTWYIDIGNTVGKVYPNKEYLPWKSIY